jgi:hypothetical protein
MALPQVADEGTASNMDGGCEYTEYPVADSRQGRVPEFGGGGWGEVLTTPHSKKRILLRNIHRVSLGPRVILWGQVAGTCECGNEPSLKCGEFLD